MGENNITYEDLKAAADENGKSVAETIQIMQRTEDSDRAQHSDEYAAVGQR
jgi:DnaJ-domain-containing protein 1